MKQIFLQRFPQGFLGIRINQACNGAAANGGMNFRSAYAKLSG